MATDVKFADRGYDVHIVSKEDILETIDNNIVDKDVALELIKELELDINAALLDNKWAGIPHIGSFRVDSTKLIEKTEEFKAARDYARQHLNTESYVLFKRTIRAENKKQEQFNRFCSYCISMALKKYKDEYKECLRTTNEHILKLRLGVRMMFKRYIEL